MPRWHSEIHDLCSLFCSAHGWAVLAVVQGLIGWVFVIQVWGFERLKPQLASVAGAPGITAIVVTPMLKSASVILLLIIPLLTMRSFSEERTNRTLPLLMSSPVTMTQLVAGKYGALMAYFCIVLGVLALMPLSLLTAGRLDLGLVAAAFLGLFLLVSSVTAAGVYVSALSPTPALAAVATFGLLLLLWILDGAGRAASDDLGEVLRYLSLVRHQDAMLRGLLDTRDIAY